MSKGVLLSKNIVRILLGMVFVPSSVLKLMSLDSFELYIFSFNLMDFALTGIAARLLIAAEMILGVALICKFEYKWSWWLGMLMTLGFTFFLVYVVIFRNDANCHCFGDLIEIDPLHSIYKNIAMMALFIFCKNAGNQRLILEKVSPEDN